MSAFDQYIQSLGGLHDCRILHFYFDTTGNELTFALDDLFGNFSGLPDYAGPTPASVILKGITAISFQLDTTGDNLNIFDLEIADDNSAMKATMRFWPGGHLNATFTNAWVISGDKTIWPTSSVNDSSAST